MKQETHHIILLFLTTLLCWFMVFTACESHYQQPNPVQDHGDYQVVNQPNGSQVVVVKDHSGTEFFMEYLMFQSLLNTVGGMNNVYNYRQQHQYDRDWDNNQRYYRSNSSTVINNYYGTNNKLDDSKPLGEQVKYKQSKGFTNTTTAVPSKQKEVKSDGFSQPTFPVKTQTPEPSYQKSNGFVDNNSTYKPSKGFESKPSTSTSSEYKPSSGFKNKTTYKPSTRFRKKN